jgi:cytochrome P450
MDHRHIPLAPRAVPVLGHSAQLLKDPLGFLVSLPEIGDLVRVRLGLWEILLVCSPELTRQLLLEHRVFDKGGPVYERVRDLLGNGVGTCPHNEHRRHRHLTQPAFRQDRFPGYARTMATQTKAFLQSWHDGDTIDVLEQMFALSGRIAVSTILAGALNEQQIDRALADLTVVMAGMFSRMVALPGWERIPTRGHRRYEHARTRLRQVIEQITIEHRSGHIDHGDLLSSLLLTSERSDLTEPQLSDAEISDQIMTFFFAGTETTANTLAWSLHFLSMCPDIQDQLHAEVDAFSSQESLQFHDLPRLDLAGRIITETLRLRTPNWILTRTTTCEGRLGDHVIPAGTTVAYSPYLIHHRADLYPDPETFDPDRWLTPDQPLRRDSFIPFGNGARKCMGDVFAMTATTLAFAGIAARWTLHPASKRQVKLAPSLVVSPRNLRIRIAQRTDG